MANFNYVKSVVNAARYNDKAESAQVDYVVDQLKKDFEDRMVAGAEITKGALLSDARQIRDSFTEEEAAIKNNAMSKFRMNLTRAIDKITGEKGSLRIGHKFGTKDKPDVITIKAAKEKKEQTVAEALAHVISVFGLDDTAGAILDNDSLKVALLSEMENRK